MKINTAGTAFRFIIIHLFTLFAVSGVCGAETAPPETAVYVGKSGTKYHRFTCRTLRSTKREMSLADAVRSGYEPCRVCNPPVTDAKTVRNEAAPSGSVLGEGGAFYRVNLENLSSYRQADIKKMSHGKVTRHVDGDTVHITLENPPEGFGKIEKIRMIGVDTPETVHPNKDVEYFGKEASDFTKNALLGRDVFIALDWETRDRYNRLLAYIYLPDGSCHNAELIRQGYAHAYTRFPFQFMEEFRGLEQEARAAKSGLWAGGESSGAASP